MILVDTSIWIDHLRTGEPGLADLLDDGQVLGHPGVTGELALGQISQRREILTLLANLPQARSASHSEVMALIDTRHLYGLGIGLIDVQLLAATLLTDGARLWTRDQRLATAASRLDLAADGVPNPLG